MSSPIKTPVLISAVAMNKTYKRKFYVPSSSELQQLAPGWLVKVSCAGERFWCELTDRAGEVLTARIDNHLVNTSEHGLRYDDLIQFPITSVYQILKP